MNGRGDIFLVSKGIKTAYNFNESCDGGFLKHTEKGGRVVMKIVLIRPSGILTKVLRKMFGIKKNK